MKQAIFLSASILISVSLQLSGQEGRPLNISGVIEVPDVSSENLYNRVYLWASEASLDGIHSIHEADRWNGVLIMTGFFPFKLKKKVFYWRRIEGDIFYRLTIYLRDGKYKYVFSHFEHEGSNEKPISYGRIYDSNTPVLYQVPDFQEEVINELLYQVKNQVTVKAEMLQGVMQKPTELEGEW